MKLFTIGNKQQLNPISAEPFALEKDMQRLTENNLNAVFGLELITSEFTLNKLRIDTLAYDPESKAFIIIEYKRNQNYSVIDQGCAYLALLLNNHADFILEYNEQQTEQLKKKDIDWTQSRVMFIAPAFTTYQKEAINFKDLPIELWQITRYNNQTVMYHHIQASKANESINTISSKQKEVTQVSAQIKVYNEDDHLAKADEAIRERYQHLKERLLNLYEIDIKFKKNYIAFVAKKNVIDIRFTKKYLRVWINMRKGELEDPKKLARDMFGKGHWGNGDYEIAINTNTDIDDIMPLIKQSYNKNK